MKTAIVEERALRRTARRERHGPSEIVNELLRKDLAIAR